MLDLGIIILMAFAAFLWALVSYTIGHKEGERIGFAKGRAIGRHASSREVL